MMHWHETPDIKVKRRITSNTTTFAASNTTESLDIFQVTGSVAVHRIWGLVTVEIGVNHTAAHLRFDDGTVQIDLSAAGGVTLSAFEVGSLVQREGLVATALIASQADQIRINDPAAAQTDLFSPVTLVAKTGTDSDIEVRYSTTDTPTSGAILWYCDWSPLSDDGAVVASF